MASISPYNSELDQRLASHLLRRASYYYSQNRVQQFVGLSPEEALSELFKDYTLSTEQPIHPETGKFWINNGQAPDTNNGPLKEYIVSWWLNEAKQNQGIQHKLEFFLHTVFVTSRNLVGKSEHFYDYLEFNRIYAAGNLRDYAFKMTRCNAMLNFLDNTENDADNPNENYARELLELFTIGKGPQVGNTDYTNFTELDVQMAARVLTGFKTQNDRTILDPETSVPIGRLAFFRHDQEDKVFSHRFQNRTIIAAVDADDMDRELKDMIAMIFEQEATAKFFCRKLYRYFVKSSIDSEIESDIISPLAKELMSKNYEIKPVIEMLLKSEHFYDMDDTDNSNNVIGALVASPMEQLLRTLTFFNIDTPDIFSDTQRFYRFYRQFAQHTFCVLSGMMVFEPPTVAGYEAYHQEPGYTKNWFNSSNIIARYKLGEMLIRGRRVLNGGDNGEVKINMVQYALNSFEDASNAEEFVDTLTSYLFPERNSEHRRDYFLNEVFLDGLSPVNWRVEWNNFLDTADDSDVRIALNRFYETLMHSQEYQCF